VEESVLDGRYRLERLLGTGGMGDVWLAEDTRLGRWVAVKWLREDSPGGLGRELEREARVIARLQHPNIVGVHDVGHAAGRPYLVMEYVHGISLRELVDDRGGALEEAEAVRYGAQVAEALAYAHDQGVFHSDIKPENILVTEDGVAKAVDFGIAQTVNRTLAPEEARGILGTIAYLAPEVIQGTAPDARSDIYSLGTTIYEMVAGRLPFSGTNPAVVAGQRLAAAPPALRTLAPQASPALETALARALALNPAQRWPNAREFARALRQTRRGQTSPIAVPPPEVHRRPPPAVAPVVVRRTGRQAPPPHRSDSSRGGMWAAVIIAGLLAIGGGVAAALIIGANDGDNDPNTEPSPTPTVVETPTAQPSPTEAPTEQPTPTPSPEPSATPTTAPSATPTPSPEPSPTPTATPSPTPPATNTPSPTPVTATPTPNP
jgi:serine/threonine-protein kinase